MPNFKQLARSAETVAKKTINWHPGHMYSGMQAIIGKLATTDAVVEVHDARIPLIGRNREFKQHLGLIKPRILVLNKSDLADLSHWNEIQERLAAQGDNEVLLTDLTGSQFGHQSRGYDTLLQRLMELIRRSDRYNRANADHFKIMIVGIPNVGKSTLINRLRQYHLGRGGEPATVGQQAGVTKHVENRIKICSRPLVYSVDTPGVLQSSQTKNKDQAMRLALCSNINDRIIPVEPVADYLLRYLNNCDNDSYIEDFCLDKPAKSLDELYKGALNQPEFREENCLTKGYRPRVDKICWALIKNFRRGLYGKVMFT